MAATAESGLTSRTSGSRVTMPARPLPPGSPRRLGSSWASAPTSRVQFSISVGGERGLVVEDGQALQLALLGQGGDLRESEARPHAGQAVEEPHQLLELRAVLGRFAQRARGGAPPSRSAPASGARTARAARPGRRSRPSPRARPEDGEPASRGAPVPRRAGRRGRRAWPPPRAPPSSSAARPRSASRTRSGRSRGWRRSPGWRARRRGWRARPWTASSRPGGWRRDGPPARPSGIPCPLPASTTWILCMARVRRTSSRESASSSVTSTFIGLRSNLH